ncbi:MAG: hypothetical protein RDU20_01475 [Desulfomonilaceae bacterium]|nr:hypothetical protein [Desulfomonilaceae bacterium]
MVCPPSFEEAVTSTLRRHQYELHTNFGFFYLCPDIPRSKLDLVKNSFELPDGERIIGYVETSRARSRAIVVFGSTALFFHDTGFVSPFLARRLLGRTRESEGSIPYVEFPNRQFKAKRLHVGVSLDKGRYLSIVDPLHRTIFVRVLNSLKHVVTATLEKGIP